MRFAVKWGGGGETRAHNPTANVRARKACESRINNDLPKDFPSQLREKQRAGVNARPNGGGAGGSKQVFDLWANESN